MKKLNTKILEDAKCHNQGLYLIPVGESISLSGVHVRVSEMVHIHNVHENKEGFSVGFNVLYGGTRKQAEFVHSFIKVNDSTIRLLRIPYKNEFIKFIQLKIGDTQ